MYFTVSSFFSPLPVFYAFNWQSVDLALYSHIVHNTALTVPQSSHEELIPEGRSVRLVVQLTDGIHREKSYEIRETERERATNRH